MKQKMIWLRSLLLASVFVSMVAGNLLVGRAQDLPASVDHPAAPAAEFAPGEILVGLRNDEVVAASLFSTLGVQGISAVDECEPAVAAAGVERITPYLLQITPGSEWETIATLSADPAVAYAEPNWLVYAADTAETEALAQPEAPYTVNDPRYLDQQWYLQRINASRAWSLAYGGQNFPGGGATIQVAVVDSGVDVDHPELSAILLEGENYVTPGAPPVDRSGHGTHVTGLIGAIINNNQGVAGVTAKVKIDPRKVLNDGNGGTIDNVARGICEAADAGAQLINLSLETPQRSPTMQQAVQYAQAEGALLIAASGNSGITAVAYPAAFDEVMAVAATTYNDQRASYSNYSNTARIIEIAAPGGTFQQSMYNTWAKGAWCRDIKDVLRQSGFCTSEGTSMAAAVVTGGAALVWSLQPELTADEVRALLKQTAAPIAASVNEVGSGRLDLHAAVRALLNSNLRLSETRLRFQKLVGGNAYTATVRLDNPSTQPIEWEVGLIGSPAWVELVGADATGIARGVAEYGEPGRLSITISPTVALAAGFYTATAQIIGTRDDTTQTRLQLAVELLVGNLSPQSHLPLVMQRMGGTVPPPTQSWETPTAAGRTALTMTDDSELAVTLPFTFTLGGRNYREIQVNANGFISLGDAPGSSTQNQCLPNNAGAGAAVYGWWADLNPAATGARVSTFSASSDRFVIEFANVPTAAKASEDYLVNFQIVLYRNGDIGLNYGQIPERQATPPPVTIGVEARDGLLYNQIACRDNQRELGYLPQPNQSILIKEEKIYG